MSAAALHYGLQQAFRIEHLFEDLASAGNCPPDDLSSTGYRNNRPAKLGHELDQNRFGAGMLYRHQSRFGEARHGQPLTVMAQIQEIARPRHAHFVHQRALQLNQRQAGYPWPAHAQANLLRLAE